MLFKLLRAKKKSKAGAGRKRSPDCDNESDLGAYRFEYLAELNELLNNSSTPERHAERSEASRVFSKSSNPVLAREMLRSALHDRLLE